MIRLVLPLPDNIAHWPFHPNRGHRCRCAKNETVDTSPNGRYTVSGNRQTPRNGDGAMTRKYWIGEATDESAAQPGNTKYFLVSKTDGTERLDWWCWNTDAATAQAALDAAIEAGEAPAGATLGEWEPSNDDADVERYYAVEV